MTPDTAAGITIEIIRLGDKTKIKVLDHGYLVGYFPDVEAVSARLANLGYTMADVRIKE